MQVTCQLVGLGFAEQAAGNAVRLLFAVDFDAYDAAGHYGAVSVLM
jgi:hypothetical protein